MNSSHKLLLAVLLAASALVCRAAEPERASDAGAFLEQAALGSLKQVELGKLAQKNANSTGVHALGERFTRTHTQIGRVLAALAQEKGYVLPTSLDAQGRQSLQALGAQTGAAFEQAYTGEMVQDFESTIVAFTEATTSDDADVAEFARRVLPVLKEDLRLAEYFHGLAADGQSTTIASRSAPHRG